MTTPIGHYNARESLLRYLDRVREDLRPEINAVIDTIVLLEVAKRGLVNHDLNLEMRLTADKHRRKSPALAAMLKLVADLLETSGVVPFPSKPIHHQEHNDVPKRH